MKKNEAIDKIKEKIYPSTPIPAPIMKFINSLYQFKLEVVDASKPTMVMTSVEVKLDEAVKILESIATLTKAWGKDE